VTRAKVEDLTLVVDGVRIFGRRVRGEGVPAVFVHGNPTDSADWLPFMVDGPPAIALDLPGWGRSDRPPDFDYTMDGLAAFHDRCLEQLGVGEHKLVVHDWGALALIGAQRQPDRVRRLVVINAVPLLPGYRWHWVARMWRRRHLGEVVSARPTRAGIALLMRQARGDRGPMPAELIDRIHRHWDRGTSRAVLELYRDADPDRLAAAGADLGSIACPALVVWGERDPYLPHRFGRLYAERLPGGTYVGCPAAGHWPWLEEFQLVDRVVEFLREDPKTREGER
jgi:pimeloyl-ACP methyl ester carboxylesterase